MVNKHNTIIITLLTLLFLIIIGILIRKTFIKEHFIIHSLKYSDPNPDEESDDFTITDYNNFERANISNISRYFLLENPVPEKENMIFLNFDTNSNLKIIRKEDKIESEYTIGFYLAKNQILDKLSENNLADISEETYTTTTRLLTAVNKDDAPILEVGIAEGNKLTVSFETQEEPLEIPLEDHNDLSYVVIEMNYNNDDFIPEGVITVNNQKYSVKLEAKQAQKIETKRFIFGSLDGTDSSVDGFDGYIGNIILFSKVLDQYTFCNNFNCDLSCFIPNGIKTYDGNVNGCIKDCMLKCDDIERCQKICINCEVEGLFWSEEEKKRRCPWLSEIKIEDMSVPDAPEIRGFPGDRSILIEWKKPFDGRGEITNYIVMFYESFDKGKGVQVSISGKSTDDIYEHEITNLKNKTYYDVMVRAVNNQGIGKPSNIITISPNGNIMEGGSNNIFNDMENDVNKEVDKMTFKFVCDTNNSDSIGHTLDYYDENDMDIRNYIQNLK